MLLLKSLSWKSVISWTKCIVRKGQLILELWKAVQNEEDLEQLGLAQYEVPGMYAFKKMKHITLTGHIL